MDQTEDTQSGDGSVEQSNILETACALPRDAVSAENPTEKTDDRATPLEEKTDASPLDQEASTSQAEDPSANSETTETIPKPPETVVIKIIHNKTKYDHSTSLDSTIGQLKREIEPITGIPAKTQKVMYKGSTNDQQILRDLKVTKGAKFMVIGSTVADLLKVQTPISAGASSANSSTAEMKSTPLSEQTSHKKVLEKYGKPDDVMTGNRSLTLDLPTVPLSGFYTSKGGKARLTFKLDSDELWLGTKERTHKLKMSNIKAVVSEPIKGNEDYHIMGIQTGPTEASRVWLYWVPAQFVTAIKRTIMGSWQYE